LSIEFLGALAFDKWIGNADARQSIFFRARLEQRLPGADRTWYAASGCAADADANRIRAVQIFMVKVAAPAYNRIRPSGLP
jgi:hypothetical protein